MGRLSVEQAERVGGNGGGGFFSLKHDKDVAKVRFLFNGIEDVEAHSVHQVEIDGKKRWVDCLRDYGDPVDACPMCKAGRFINVKYFIPLYNLDADSPQIWERGKKFGSKLSSMCARYPNIVSHIFEIERNGKQGDQQTSYEIYETGETEGVTLDDFEVQNPVGTIILQKSADELQFYLDNGYFPDNGNTREANEAPTYQRRTPSNSAGRREAF